MKIDARDLRAGAYRIVSGDDWLVLVGDDTDFQPIEPWAKSANESLSGQVHREWVKISGGMMGRHASVSFKDRLRLPGDIGLPEQQRSGNAVAICRVLLDEGFW